MTISRELANAKARLLVDAARELRRTALAWLEPQPR